jgi:CBS domain-containing protein
MYQVKDAMSHNVVSIRPEATVDAAIRVLLDNGVSGAPVIDDSGKLCGVISQFQLLEVLYDPQVRNCRVAEMMTRNVLTVEDTTLLGVAASQFVVHRIRRLPVVQGGRVIGILSRSDLLRYFIKTGENLESFFAKLKGTTQGAATAVLPSATCGATPAPTAG